MKMHQDKGVHFHCGVGVAGIVCDESGNKVKQLKLTDDSLVDADVVVLGIGKPKNHSVMLILYAHSHRVSNDNLVDN